MSVDHDGPALESADQPHANAPQNLSTFRELLVGTPLRRMEDLSSREMSAGDAQANAAEILHSGWVRRGYPPVDLVREIPWEESALRNRSWSFHLHCWDLLDSILLAYTGDEQNDLLKISLRVAKEWIARFSTFHKQSIFAWYDMAVGLRAARLAFLVDAAARTNELSDDDLLILLMSAEQHRAYLADDKNIVFHNNHGFYQAAGQAALAKRLSLLPKMAEGYEQAKARLVVMLDRQFSSDNVHNEHSPDYHRMVLRTFGSLMANGLLDDPELAERYVAQERALAWFVYPNGRIVNFGDSDARDLTRDRKHAERAWQTDEMRWCASHGAVGQPDPSEHALFERSGYFVVRRRHDVSEPSSDSYLAVMASFHSRTHKHADDLSLVWFERGQHILIDAGRYGYLGKTLPGSDLWKAGFWYADPARIYCESTHAHNTIEIDESSYPRRLDKPYGSAIVSAGRNNDVFFWEARALHFETVWHSRTVLFCPRQWLLVFDALHDTSALEHRYTQWWHFANGSRIAPQRSRYWRIDIPGLDKPVDALLLAPEDIETVITNAQTEPRLQGWWSPSEGALEPAPVLGLRPAGSRARATFATLFSLNGRPDEAMISTSTPDDFPDVDWCDDLGRHSLRVKRTHEPERSLVIDYTRDVR